MKRKEFKEKLFDALKSDVDNMSYDEKMILVNNLLIDFEKENEYLRDTSNKGQKWKDEELKIILSDAPSKELEMHLNMKSIGMKKPFKKRQQELLRERELSIILQNMSVALRIERQQYEFMERNA